MMKMKLRMHDLLYVVHSVYVALIIAALTLIGCSESDPSASDLSEQDFAQIVAEVEEAVWAFHAWLVCLSTQIDEVIVCMFVLINDITHASQKVISFPLLTSFSNLLTASLKMSSLLSFSAEFSRG